MFARKQKKNDFPDIYVTILEATQIPPKFVINKNTKGKFKETIQSAIQIPPKFVINKNTKGRTEDPFQILER